MKPTGLLDLSPEQKKLQESAREVAQVLKKNADQADRERWVPSENWDAIKSAGFYGALVPKAYGGLGLGMFEYSLILEQLGQGCSGTSMAFNMHQMSMSLMRGAGLESVNKDKFAYLCDLTVNNLMSAVASEPGGNSLIYATLNPTSYVEVVEGGYKLYGRKQFGTNFEASRYSMVMFHIKDSPNATESVFLLIDTKMPGVNVEDTWDTLGLRATRSNSVFFDGLFIPEEQTLLRGSDFFQSLLQTSSAEFYHTFSSVYLGILTAMLDWAQQYLLSRVPRGYTQPMAYHPSSLQTIGALIDRLDQARLIVRQVSLTYDTHGNIPESFYGFAKAKLAITNALMEAVRTLPSACGANSLYNKNPLPRLMRDAMVATVMPPHMWQERELAAIGAMDLDMTKIQPPLG
ncbi:MAG: acyl-CoA dehydrogenase family protein [Pseudomonadota bacterium]|nr:acyl-CoA dehydrogenase family protein [Pseudomonadota bacterium]